LKRQMVYEYAEQRGINFRLSIEDVKELLFMNKSGKKPKSLEDFAIEEKIKVDESKHEDLVGQVTLQTLEQKGRKKQKSGNGNNRNQQGNSRNQSNSNRNQNSGTTKTLTTNTGNRNQGNKPKGPRPNPNQNKDNTKT